jgi:rhodanese-related sulfurtransferase
MHARRHSSLADGRGHRIRPVLLSIVALAVMQSAPASANAGFPLRDTYPDVKTLSTAQLEAELGRTPIIDVRSEFEYEVIHIRGAISNPIARSSFETQLHALTGNDPEVRLVFYCNGHTCAKSYKAARRAREIGYLQSFAYDAGVFEWTRTHPDEAVLLGETPVDLAKLIPSRKLARHNLEASRFVAEAQGDSAILIDVRDPMQRKRTPDFGDKEIANYYMAKLARALASDRFRESTKGHPLYVFDATGKQVRWLQYHLEAHGYQDYYFLDGGVWSIFGAEGAN